MKGVVFTTLGIATRVALTGAALTSWFTPCPSPADFPESQTQLSCAYFNIPLDYNNASAGTGQLLVVKANATAGEKKGTIFFNPGGPGSSGLLTLQDESEALMNRTGGVYDFVSWDPRGVGPYTYPGDVYCLSDDEFSTFWNGTIEATGINWLGNFTNETDLSNLYAQAGNMDAKYKEFGQRCLQGPNGTTLQYVGTAATVRDLVGLADAIVGPESPIFYWGFSYGTLVGAWLANMFPKRVGRIILDGVLDATQVATTQSYKLWRTQVSSAEDVYHAFANACAMAGSEKCRLAPFQGASGADVITNVSQVLEVVHSPPPNVVANFALLRDTILSGLYEASLWEQFANNVIPGFIEGLEGHPSNTYMKKKREMRKRASFTQNSYTQSAIACADSVSADPSLSMKNIFDEVVDVARTVSPTFGAIWPTLWYYCSYWPVRAPERYQGPFNSTFANKVLVIGNTYDPATPFFEAQHMAEVLGDQAALVRQDGFGHTSLFEPSKCVTDIVIAYLKDGSLPSGTASAPTICAIDSSFEIFPGVKAVDVRSNGTASDTNATSPTSSANSSAGAMNQNSSVYLLALAVTVVSIALDCTTW